MAHIQKVKEGGRGGARETDSRMGGRGETYSYKHGMWTLTLGGQERYNTLPEGGRESYTPTSM